MRDAVSRVLRFGLVLIAMAWSGAFATDPQPDEAAAIAFSQAAIGATVGDYSFATHAGGKRRLSEYRGRPLLVSFVYTGCVDACPVAVRFLQRSVAEARQVFGTDAFSVAVIGFNQPFDDPQAMRAFAARHGLTGQGWEFLSPDTASVEPLTRAFGFSWYSTPKGYDHIAQVSLVDGDGRIYRQIYGEDFQAPLLIEPLKQLITDKRVPAGDWRVLVQKVRLLCTVYDRSTGRYRLDYSLFFGIAIGLGILAAVAGGLLREWRGHRARAMSRK